MLDSNESKKLTPPKLDKDIAVKSVNLTESNKSDMHSKSEQTKQNKHDEQDKQNKYEQHQITNNYINLSKTQDMIIVKHEHDNFVFYNSSKILIGYFSIIQLIRYITTKICDSFLSDHNIGTSNNIIETYICMLDNDEIKLIDHIKSYFMGNINMVMKLYKDIEKYELNSLQDDLNKCSASPIVRKNIIDRIKQLNYILLNQILKLSLTISDTVKSSLTPDMKELLLKYSVKSLYKISSQIKHQIDEKTVEFKSLQDDLTKIQNLKTNLQQKIDELNASINQQSNIIQNGGNKIIIPNMTSSSSSSNSSTSSSSSSIITSQSQTNKSITLTQTNKSNTPTQTNKSITPTQTNKSITPTPILTSSQFNKTSSQSDKTIISLSKQLSGLANK